MAFDGIGYTRFALTCQWKKQFLTELTNDGNDVPNRVDLFVVCNWSKSSFQFAAFLTNHQLHSKFKKILHPKSLINTIMEQTHEKNSLVILSNII